MSNAFPQDLKKPLADAIVEVTETGSSLRANKLRIVETVMESNTQLIANKTALADLWKRTKIENIALLLKAAIEAQGRVGLMLNVRRTDLQCVLDLLPALQRPMTSSITKSTAEMGALKAAASPAAAPQASSVLRSTRSSRSFSAYQPRALARVCQHLSD